jgi:hypothetical protein
LIYFAGQDICFDSLGDSHLSIRRYLEYNLQNKQLLIAKGNRYADSIAPVLGLNKFYKIRINDFPDIIVEDINFKYISDTSFFSNKHDPWYYFIILEKMDGTHSILSFGRYDSIPNDIYILQKKIDSLINSRALIRCEKFNVDSIVFHIERKLFKKFPPPPKPENIEEVKFERP